MFNLSRNLNDGIVRGLNIKKHYKIGWKIIGKIAIYNHLIPQMYRGLRLTVFSVIVILAIQV